uniref:Putative odv-e56 n=1 Tax=Kallithea virus TaxID=1654582 RepID=A0A0F7KIV7_9VIRU|nr:putative odv-e56 [Kallithea virus]
MSSESESAIVKFARALHNSSRADLASVRSLTSDFKSNNATLQKIINGAKITRDDRGYIYINRKTVNSFSKLLRQGDIYKLLPNNVNDSDELRADAQNLEVETVDFPENRLYKVEKAISVNNNIWPELAVTFEQLQTASNSVLEKLKSIESKVNSKYDDGHIIQLTVGYIEIGPDWISKTLQRQTGCFAVYNEGKEKLSCKIMDQSCTGIETTNLCPKYNYRNFMLDLMSVVEAEDTNLLKINLSKLTKIDVDKLRTSIKHMLKIQFSEIYDLITTSEVPTYKICSISNEFIENGIIPNCRMCSMTADPETTKYIERGQTPFYSTFKSNGNPTALDIISDLEVTTNTILLSKEGKINPIFVWILLVIIAIVVIIIAIFTLFRAKIYLKLV